MSSALKCLGDVIAELDSETKEGGQQLDIRDVYGHEMSDIELLQELEKTPYFIGKHVTVQFVAKDGKWAFKRHKNNLLRGDDSSIADHRASLRQVGLLQELGGEHFIVQSPDTSNDEQYEACHFASRFEALKEEWEADISKEQKAIRISLANGARRCKLFSRNSPDWLTIFLVACGNVANGTATITTVLEKWIATADIGAAWKRKVRVMHWTTNSMAQTTHDSIKFSFINASRRNWYQDYRSYEVSTAFYTEASKTRTVLGDPKSETIWNSLVTRARKEADLSSMTPAMQSNTFRVANDIMRIFKPTAPEKVVPLLLMFLPKTGTPRGQCSLLPQGVPMITNNSAGALQSLLTEMTDTVTMSEHRGAQDKKTNAASQTKEGYESAKPEGGNQCCI